MYIRISFHLRRIIRERREMCSTFFFWFLNLRKKKKRNELNSRIYKRENNLSEIIKLG